MIRRQGATSALLTGACNERNILRRATANRLGPLSIGSSRLTVCVSVGASQYGLASTKDRLALILGLQTPRNHRYSWNASMGILFHILGSL